MVLYVISPSVVSVPQNSAMQIPNELPSQVLSVSSCDIPHIRFLTLCDVDHVQSCDGDRLRQWAAFECVLARRIPLDGSMLLGTFPRSLAPLDHTAELRLISCLWPTRPHLPGIMGFALTCASLSV